MDFDSFCVIVLENPQVYYILLSQVLKIFLDEVINIRTTCPDLKDISNKRSVRSLRYQ
jgi:hypothetical protein